MVTSSSSFSSSSSSSSSSGFTITASSTSTGIRLLHNRVPHLIQRAALNLLAAVKQNKKSVLHTGEKLP